MAARFSRFEQLRALLAGAPSQLRWLELRELLDSWEDEGELREVALPYAAGHLEPWPDELRFAHGHWLAAALRGQDVPHLALVRSLQQPRGYPGGPAPRREEPDPNDYWRDVFFGPKVLARVLALPGLAGLRHVSIPPLGRGEHVPGALLNASMERLEGLELEGLRVPPAVLGPLLASSRLRPLRRLSLWFSESSQTRGSSGSWVDAWLARWPHPALEELTLIASGESARALLEGLRQSNGALRHLKLISGSQATVADALVAAGGSIRDLVVSSHKLDVDGAAQLVACPELARVRMFTVSPTFQPPALERLLCALPATLRVLDLHGLNPDEPEALLRSPCMAKLLGLNIDGWSLPAGFLDALAERAPRLKRLSLDRCDAPAEGFAGLARLPLMALQAHATTLGDDALSALGALPTLEELDLSASRVSAAGVQALAGSAAMARLRALDLGELRLGGAAFVALVGSPHLNALEELTCSLEGIHEDIFEALRKPSGLLNLRTLTLKGPLTPGAGCALAASTLAERLEELDLSSIREPSLGAREAIGRSALPDRWKGSLRAARGWTLRDVLAFAPDGYDAALLKRCLDSLLPGEVEVEDHSDLFLRLKRWWPAEPRRLILAALAERGITPPSTGLRVRRGAKLR